jgi:DNA-binding transcriptional ArsR family regulator
MSLEQFNKEGFERALTLIKALDNPKRFMILSFLCEEELTVSELAEMIELNTFSDFITSFNITKKWFCGYK